VRRRFALATAALATGAFGLRVAYLFAMRDRLHYGLDTNWYELVARTIAKGHGVVDPATFYSFRGSVPTAFRPPLYPTFLAALIKYVHGSRLTFQLAGCVVGAVTVVLTAVLGRRVAGARVGLVAGALASVSPVLFAVDVSVMAETIYVPLVLGAVVLTVDAVTRPVWWRFAAAGALVGLSALARGDGITLVLLMVLPAALFAGGGGWRPRLLHTGVAVLAVLAVIGPWVARNQHRLGQPTLATLDVATTLAGANCRASYYGSDLGSWDHACTVRPGDARLSEVQLTRSLEKQAARYARHHAVRLPLVGPVRVLRLWGFYDPAGEARREAVESRNEKWQLVAWAWHLPVVALAGYGFVLLWRRRRAQCLVLLAVVAAVTLTGLLTYGKSRLVASSEPVLLVAAATAAVEALSALRRSAPGPLGLCPR
jgi:dolichyl-phosphate-mannose-protein mannosyltransferase